MPGAAKREVLGVMMTPKEELFVTHPDALTNPRKAALDAGYSVSFANKDSYGLRTKFAALLVEQARSRLDAMGATDGRLLKELGALALYNVIDAYETIDTEVTDKEGKTSTRKITVLKDLKKLPDKLQRAVKKVKFETALLKDGTFLPYVSEIEFHDKLGALRDYLRVRGIYEPPKDSGKPPAETNPLDDLSVEELEAVASIHDAARKRLEQRASKMRDDEAIDVRPVDKAGSATAVVTRRPPPRRKEEDDE